MAITIRCRCGASFDVQLSDANSFGRCPQPECRAWVRIPPEGILGQFEGQAVAADDLEAAIPDRRKVEFEGAAPPAPGAPEYAPAPQDAELPTLTLDEPAAQPSQQPAGDYDLPTLGLEEPEAPAGHPAPEDGDLPCLELDEPPASPSSGASNEGGATKGLETSREPGFTVISGSIESWGQELSQASEESGEMYYQCPKCAYSIRINDIGKMMLKTGIETFRSQFGERTCKKCGHHFVAHENVKRGNCPDFDYDSQVQR